jgi:hypothetical protein
MRCCNVMKETLTNANLLSVDQLQWSVGARVGACVGVCVCVGAGVGCGCGCVYVCACHSTVLSVAVRGCQTRRTHWEEMFLMTASQSPPGGESCDFCFMPIGTICSTARARLHHHHHALPPR